MITCFTYWMSMPHPYYPQVLRELLSRKNNSMKQVERWENLPGHSRRYHFLVSSLFYLIEIQYLFSMEGFLCERVDPVGDYVQHQPDCGVRIKFVIWILSFIIY